MTTERKPHKWAEVIKAWADGKQIQVMDTRVNEWADYENEQLTPDFSLDYFKWRVKPENIVIEGEISPNHHFGGGYFCVSSTKNNLRLEFDHDTKKLLKAEVIG